MKLKSVIVTVLVLAVLTVSGIIGIKEYKKEKNTNNETTDSSVSLVLSTPQNLTIDGVTISWDEVENAESYVVEINGACFETKYNFYLYAFFTGLEYSVRVKAVSGDENYEDSALSEYVYVGK